MDNKNFYNNIYRKKLNISEFAKTTGLTRTTLYWYHSQGLLIPDKIDTATGYRYYSVDSIFKAIAIKSLRSLDFSLPEIKEMVTGCKKTSQLLNRIINKRDQLFKLCHQYQKQLVALDSFINQMQEPEVAIDYEIKHEKIPDLYVYGIRVISNISSAGEITSDLVKKTLLHAKGLPISLIYDIDFKKEYFDFEICVEARKKEIIAGVSYHKLKGGEAVTLLHKGPIETLVESYQKLYDYAKNYNFKVQLPLREIVLRGPELLALDPKEYLHKIVFVYTHE